MVVWIGFVWNQSGWLVKEANISCASHWDQSFYKKYLISLNCPKWTLRIPTSHGLFFSCCRIPIIYFCTTFYFRFVLEYRCCPASNLLWLRWNAKRTSSLPWMKASSKLLTSLLTINFCSLKKQIMGVWLHHSFELYASLLFLNICVNTIKYHALLRF